MRGHFSWFVSGPPVLWPDRCDRRSRLMTLSLAMTVRFLSVVMVCVLSILLVVIVCFLPLVVMVTVCFLFFRTANPLRGDENRPIGGQEKSKNENDMSNHV